MYFSIIPKSELSSLLLGSSIHWGCEDAELLCGPRWMWLKQGGRRSETGTYIRSHSEVSMCSTMQPVQSLVTPDRHSAFYIGIINLIITFNTPECDVILMEPFWYATVVTKTFTRLWTVWPNPCEAESYPESSVPFLMQEHGLWTHTCTALRGREVWTRSNLSG